MVVDQRLQRADIKHGGTKLVAAGDLREHRQECCLCLACRCRGGNDDIGVVIDDSVYSVRLNSPKLRLALVPDPSTDGRMKEIEGSRLRA